MKLLREEETGLFVVVVVDILTLFFKSQVIYLFLYLLFIYLFHDIY